MESTTIWIRMGNNPNLIDEERRSLFITPRPHKPASNTNGQGTKKRCFARGIIAHHQVEMRIELEFCKFKPTEILDGELVNPHYGSLCFEGYSLESNIVSLRLIGNPVTPSQG